MLDLVPNRLCKGFTSLLQAQTRHRSYRSSGILKPRLPPHRSPKTRQYSQRVSGNGHLPDILRVSDEVSHALATRQPVVALESTIYTHGAIGIDLRLESIVRQHGAIPAVCGVYLGTPTVGLTQVQIEQMIHDGARKVSRRDLAYLVGTVETGRSWPEVPRGTTIAGTMILAKLAGIRVFGTGGLGGVHRGGESSMDISADLTELGRTRVAVVSSGCKGFLDIPRTLEFLETQGVLVSTFSDGRGDRADFPAFWARESGLASPSVVQDEKQAASIILAQERLGIESGLLFANPIPEEFAIPRSQMQAAILQAVREADERGISGSENTPFILTRLKELTDGATIPANIALVQANVERAAKIAVELCRLEASQSQVGAHTSRAYVGQPPGPENPRIIEQLQPRATTTVLVAGSIALDLSCDYNSSRGRDGSLSESPALHTSNPATIRQSIGGVGHNVAMAAHRVGGHLQVKLCSLLADDVAGSTVLSAMRDSGLDTAYIRQLSQASDNARTAQYVAINDTKRSLMLAMADMDILTEHSLPAHWASVVAATKPEWLVVDANWSAEDIHAWIRTARQHNTRIAFEPVSNAKAARLFAPVRGGAPLGVYPNASIDLATPNEYELTALYDAAKQGEHFENAPWFGVIDAFGIRGARDRFVQITSAAMTDAGIPQRTVQLLPYMPTIVTKLGAQGALLTEILDRDDPPIAGLEVSSYLVSRTDNDHPHVGGVYMRLFPPGEHVEDVVSVNGVGDTFLGVLVAGLAQGGRVENLIDVAQKGAALTLRSNLSVSAEMATLKEALALAAGRQ